MINPELNIRSGTYELLCGVRCQYELLIAGTMSMGNGHPLET
jgi:hypothetical protein